MASLRRSRRSASTTYDANGRDYLAGQFNWSLEELSGWLRSPSVHKHLCFWHKICIDGQHRFNVAVDWINQGDGGYYYNPGGLEEDLLLSCLGEGSKDMNEEASVYGRDAVHVSQWSTQELWARAAWRVVQSNCGDGDIFQHALRNHPASAYAFVIDILCIAFHSIAFRGLNSIWHNILTDKLQFDHAAMSEHSSKHSSIMEEIEESQDGGSDASWTPGSGSDVSSVMAVVSSKNEANTAIQNENSDTSISQSPSTENTTVQLKHRDCHGSVQPDSLALDQQVQGDDSYTGSMNQELVHTWVQDLSSSSKQDQRVSRSGEDRHEDGQELTLIDEHGLPIKGYRRARTAT